jgi:hypothetical protein
MPTPAPPVAAPLAYCRGCWTRCSRVAIAQANDSESSVAERRSWRTATRGSGCGPEAGPQPDAEVSDQFGLVSEADQFRASESWPGSRLFRWSCPGRHAEHRAHNAGFLAGRSLAAFGIFGSARAVSDCLASLRPAERTQRELGSSVADAEWSAAVAKLASQSSGAGRTVPRR